MSDGIEFKGLTELEVALEEMVDMEAVKKVVKHNGSRLEQEMKSKAVFVKGYSKGTTREGIHLTISDGGFTATVEPRTLYSPYLEYGTRYMAAQPFVGPAFNTVKPEFLSYLRKLVR